MSWWVRQIGALALLAALAQLLLPRGGQRGAVSLVVGLVIILAVLEPAAQWITRGASDVPWDPETFFSSADPYILAGAAWLDEAHQTVIDSEQKRMEKQLAALITLTKGVGDAQVTYAPQNADETGVLHIQLTATDDAASDREEIEVQVRQFVHRLIAMSDRIDVTWRDPSGTAGDPSDP